MSAKIAQIAAAALVTVLVVSPAAVAQAKDVVRLMRPHSDLDRRHIYNNAILSAALQKTAAVCGDYEIRSTLPPTQRDRALLEMISGQHINVHIVPTNHKWEQKTIPIRIPLVKGLLGYRLFLIKRHDSERFANIHSIDQLKTLKAGLRQQWCTTRALQALGFDVVTGSSYEGLFHMLINDRFDYFPRGINEIFEEQAIRQKSLPQMVIEPTKALYLPMPTYVFVSPNQPELAQRIETGLRAMIQDGSFDRLFRKFHQDNMRKAKLAQREVFTLVNPLLPADSLIENEELWIHFHESSNETCSDEKNHKPR